MLDWLRILAPDFWVMNYPYCREWDEELNHLMDKYDFEPGPGIGYTAKLGDRIIWIENYPYAAFHPYHPIDVCIRPKRITILRARRKLMIDLMRHK